MDTGDRDLSAPTAAAFVARSPLFDRDLRLAGYLLTGGADGDASSGWMHATGREWMPRDLVSELAGGVPAWLSVPGEPLLDRDFPHALRGDVVVEVPASVLADQRTVAACRDWHDAGFRLAVQANADDRAREALYALASVVRVALPRGAPEAPIALPGELAGLRCPLVVSGVDTVAAQRAWRDAGVAYFQGRFFTAPDAVSPARQSVSFATVARLMSMLEQPELGDRAIEAELRADPTLSLKLLRMVNSSVTGMRAVGSILHAIQIIGRNGLQRWLALLAVEGSVAGTAIERERRQIVLERARLCELIAEGSGLRRHASSLFLTGMLAAMAPMTGASPTEAMPDVRVNSDVADALAGRGGLYAPVLQLASAYAAADWRVVQALGQQLRVIERLPAHYRSAIRWAREALARA